MGADADNARPTLRDVARVAHVSPQTVSNFLRGRHEPRPDTRSKIERAVRELNYQPHAAARALRSQHVGALAILLEDPNRLGLAEPLHVAMLNGAAHAAHDRAHTLIFSVTEPNEAEAEAERLVRERRADGVILSMGDVDSSRARKLRRLAENAVPLVLIQQRDMIPGISLVAADDELGASQVVEHLLSLGHHRLAFISGTPPWPAPTRRLEAARMAAAAGGAELSEWQATAYTVDAAREAAHAAFSDPARPTGVLAANDVLALGAIQEALRQGWGVPEDISVVGFNDSDFSAWMRPSITTVRVPGALMGERAVQILVESILNGRTTENVVFPTELIVRGSSGACRDPDRVAGAEPAVGRPRIAPTSARFGRP